MLLIKVLCLNLSKKNNNKTNKADDGGTKNVEIMSSLKYLSNFWETLKITIINCEINVILFWSNKCVLPTDTKATTFTITDTTFYVTVVTLST